MRTKHPSLLVPVHHKSLNLWNRTLLPVHGRSLNPVRPMNPIMLRLAESMVTSLPPNSQREIRCPWTQVRANPIVSTTFEHPPP